MGQAVPRNALDDIPCLMNHSRIIEMIVGITIFPFNCD